MTTIIENVTRPMKKAIPSMIAHLFGLRAFQHHSDSH